ncbi:alpha/beta hydrolase [Actomonas aquatica]|uniref:Alpha/beta hydrolase n=1 Tax=Actomonas aquatica TaxID=2866162 RepID=A0ABZ1C5P6_9BACT|nr:alpha/beta hydrolase [Opitutus sp. WL0086]WRQ86732.1 alpha/beta hydrolase [Opitutus sp. WL0086]
MAASTYHVVLDETVNGRFVVEPALPVDGQVAEGTVLTVRTTPAEGYVLDAGYYSVPGRWGAMYHESMTAEFEVVVDQNKHIGASFVPAAAVAHVEVLHDVVYAQPGVKPLKYDVFTPKGARDLPIIVIIHGGGWTTNDENIMRGLARELTKGGQFVAVSIDYRWAGLADGDAEANSMVDLIEDCYGAIAHIMEHAADYGGDASRIGVTGDSAGGHLSASMATMIERVGDGGFGETEGVFEFMPSYLPAGKSVDVVRDEMLTAIRAAAPSYGVFGGPFLNLYLDDPRIDDAWKQAIMPLHAVPAATVRAVPHYVNRGTKDGLISDAMCTEYVDALVAQGQRVQYVQVGGAGHAFFDWKPDAETRATFAEYGVYYAAEMKAFFASVLSGED